MQIQNVVASIGLETKLPLNELLHHLKDSEYEPEQFPALIYRLQEKKGSFLIFQTGKIVCIGARSIAGAKEAFAELIKQIKKSGIKVPQKYVVKVENIVATDQIAKKLELDQIAFELEKSEYEPETFPGIVYRIYDPKASFLLFSSGKIVCAGARTTVDVKKAILKLKKTLRAFHAL
ncbi:MAG: TATA-box-binding protein [Candidatus Aenigmatarchaeota archaeon]